MGTTISRNLGVDLVFLIIGFVVVWTIIGIRQKYFNEVPIDAASGYSYQFQM